MGRAEERRDAPLRKHVGLGDVEERGPSFGSDRLGDQGFPGAGGAKQEDPFGALCKYPFLEQLRSVDRERDQFMQLVPNGVERRDVSKARLCRAARDQ